MRSVRLTIDLSALKSNLDLAKSLSSDSGSKVFAVIKANAYGHGAVVCAKALDDSTDGFAVVVTNEALALIDAGIQSPVMVIQGAQDDQALLESVRKGIQLSIHSSYQIDAIRRLSAQFTQPLKVWIKLDSGMGRLGFRLEELDQRLEELGGLSHVTVVGCFSHFSCADEVDSTFTAIQLEAFNKVVIGKNIARSLANSAATLTQPASHADWIRPGIMLYGANPLWPRPVAGLQAVMTVKAPFVSIRNVYAGESIGYGNTYHSTQDMRVGVLAIGYGDGYPRHIQAGTSVLYDGRRCLILGRVSMDSIVIDLTGVTEPKIGEMAILWGDGLPVEELADKAGTLSYELLCQIRGDVEYIGEGL